VDGCHDVWGGKLVKGSWAGRAVGSLGFFCISYGFAQSAVKLAARVLAPEKNCTIVMLVTHSHVVQSCRMRVRYVHTYFIQG
jgi:hypothetical protein